MKPKVKQGKSSWIFFTMTIVFEDLQGGYMDLYVGNLPLNLDSTGLKKLVEMYASVQGAKIIQAEGVSRGFGFVTVSEEEAQTVIEKLNGQLLEGKRISVKKAYQKKPAFKKVFISKQWREKAAEKL